MRRCASLVPPLVLLAAAAGCLEPKTVAPPPTTASATPEPAFDLRIIGTDVALNPENAWVLYPEIARVPLNATVVLTLSNARGNSFQHSLVIDGYGIKIGPIQSGTTANRTFAADKAGVFQYYCDVGNHRDLGMEGTLTVHA